MSHTAQHEENHGTGEIKKVTIILSVLTIVELLLGFWMIDITSEALRLAIKGTIIILMMAKAFYIVAYFMHLKHELKKPYHDNCSASRLVYLVYHRFFMGW
jgi:cytochrome c oxidase subunit IV